MILMLWTDVCLAMNRSVADAELPAALPADARAARERGLAGDSDGADGIALQMAGRGRGLERRRSTRMRDEGRQPCSSFSRLSPVFL